VWQFIPFHKCDKSSLPATTPTVKEGFYNAGTLDYCTLEQPSGNLKTCICVIKLSTNKQK
jgi:hypothetical protein